MGRRCGGRLKEFSLDDLCFSQQIFEAEKDESSHQLTKEDGEEVLEVSSTPLSTDRVGEKWI